MVNGSSFMNSLTFCCCRSMGSVLMTILSVSVCDGGSANEDSLTHTFRGYRSCPLLSRVRSEIYRLAGACVRRRLLVTLATAGGMREEHLIRTGGLDARSPGSMFGGSPRQDVAALKVEI